MFFLDLKQPTFGPVDNPNSAYPSVIKIENIYYVYATQNKKGTNVTVAKFYHFKNWEVLEQDALADPGPWAERNVWASDVTQPPPGTFVMCYTAVQKNTDKRRCISVAKASSSTGLFIPQGTKPIVSMDDGTAYIFAGWTGARNPQNKGHVQRWLLHKFDRDHSSIWAQARLSNGLNTEGARFWLTHEMREEGWDNGALTVVYTGGTFVLFHFAHSLHSTAYTTSVATAPKLQCPWTKKGEPLLEIGDGKE